ncbi:MAG: hypothetical protein WA941_23605 [Nitrososphaeraceae archaeon]
MMITDFLIKYCVSKKMMLPSAFILVILSILVVSASYFTTVSGSSITADDDQSKGVTSAKIDPLTGTIDKFLTYDNVALGIQIQYPLDWKRSETENTVTFIASPLDPSEIYPEALVSILVTPSEGATLNELANGAIANYREIYNDFTLVDSGPLTSVEGAEKGGIGAGGIPAHFLRYTYTDSLLGPARVLEIGMIADNKLYIVKYIATPATFSTYFLTFQKMFDSLKILSLDIDNEDVRLKVNNDTTTATTTNITAAYATNFLTYEDPDYGWKIQYPSDWQTEEEKEEGEGGSNSVSFVSPIESTSDRYPETLIVSVYPFSQNLSLDEFSGQTFSVIASRTDFTLIQSDRTTIGDNNNSAQIFVYTYSDPIMGQTEAMNIETISGEKAYVIEYYAKPETYSQYLPIVQKMINSFELISNNNNNNTDNSLLSITNLTQQQQQEQTDFLTYEDPDFGFTIKYPDDWVKEVYEDGAGFISPKKDFYDRYGEYLDIFVYSAGSREVPYFRSVNTPLLEVVREELRARQDAYNDFQLLSSNSTTLVNGTVPAEMLSFIYSHPVVGQTKVTAIIAIKGENMYVLEYRAKPDQFSDSLPIAQQMIDSFSILDDIIRGDSTTDVIAPGFLIYENPTYSVKIQHPSSWTIKENAPPNAFVDFISPPEDALDRYFESIELYFYPAGNMSYFPTADTPLDDKFIQGEINFLNETFAGFELLDSRPISLKGSNNSSSSNIPVYMIEFTQIDQNGLTRSLEVISKIGGSVYVLFYSAMPDKYSQYLPTIQKMIDSFQVIESTTAPLSNFFTYENPTVGIRMQYPGDWQDQYFAPKWITPSQEFGYRVEFISPQSALVSSGVSAKDVAVFEIASILSPSVGGIDDKSAVLNKAANTILDGLAQNLVGFVFIESTPTTLLGSNNPAHKIVYTYLDPDLGRIKEMELITLGGEKNEGMYVVTYSGKTTTYEFFLPTVQKMLDSMEVLFSTTITTRSESPITDNNEDTREENIISFDPDKNYEFDDLLLL